jgi:hypothetical protein
VAVDEELRARLGCFEWAKTHLAANGTSLEPRIRSSAPLLEGGRHILAGGPIELEARGEILVTRKLRVDSDGRIAWLAPSMPVGLPA